MATLCGRCHHDAHGGVAATSEVVYSPDSFWEWVENIGGEAESSEEKPMEEKADAETVDEDLTEVVIEAIRSLDPGDGVQQEVVIVFLASEHYVDSETIENAIQDALLSGQCDEPSEGLLKTL